MIDDGFDHVEGSPVEQDSAAVAGAGEGTSQRLAARQSIQTALSTPYSVAGDDVGERGEREVDGADDQDQGGEATDRGRGVRDQRRGAGPESYLPSLRTQMLR